MAAGENVLAAALAAGIPLPNSCRQGRCASCRATLLSGEISYPETEWPHGTLPPGLSAAEAAAGAVLLCQAQPRSDLVVRTRATRTPSAAGVRAEIVDCQPLAFEALRLRVRLADGMPVRAGQFVDAKNDQGLVARMPVTASRVQELELEAANDGSEFREWLATRPTRAWLTLDGPFDAPR